VRYFLGVRRVLACLGLLVSAGLAAAEPIKEIVVADNHKTSAQTVELIANLQVGDEWTPDMADRVKADLVSSGLFKDVEVFWSKVDGGVRVHILVKDKHSWVVAPAFYNQPTNTGAGIGFGENNLFGLNQKLLLYAQIATGDSFFVGAWVIPSIKGTRFSAQIDTYLKQSRYIEYAAPTSWLDNPEPVRESRMNYLNAGLKLGVELMRGVRFEARLRGAKVSYPSTGLFGDEPALKYVGADPANQARDLGTAEGAPVPKPGTEGWDVTNELSLTIDRRANWYGIASGYRYAFSFERALPMLGSDFRYYMLGASYYRAWKILQRHNLVLRFAANYGHHLPFQQEFSLGGTSMRGWLNYQFRGDVRGLANVEYSVPIFTIQGLSIRGLAFFDSGYTTFLTTSNPDRSYLPSSRRDQQDLLAGFKNSIGLGTRLYLRQIVLPLLGLDFGYGLEARDFQVYLAIGLTD
jgi:outer membrane protein insertion porin family